MKNFTKFLIVIILGVAAMLLAMGVGSVYVPAGTIWQILLKKIFAIAPSVPIDPLLESIFWEIRLPRTLLAFITGSGLAVSGVIMQSVLRNPLASSSTLGVSSGSVVGASIAMLLGLNFFGAFTIPFFGLVAGLITVFSAIALAARMDKNMSSTTIILTGTAFSFFASAIITFILAWAKESTQRLIFWQMGSFTLKDWSHPAVLFPIVFVGSVIVFFFAREMDLMTFGEESAKASGVNVNTMKWLLLSIAAIMTGSASSFSGIIGFVDLFTPHIARQIFGANHRLIVPASGLIGGIFLVLCDLIARTAASPMELPVGAVTAIIGAPFFLYIFFSKKKEF